MSRILVEQDGAQRKASATFFRGETTNFYPSDTSLERAGVVSDYFAKGWMPAERFVTRDTPIVAFGSCFAENISRYLHKAGFNVLTKRDNLAYVSSMGDGMVNTFAIRQQFEWAWLGKTPQAELWHGYDAAEFGYDEAVRLRTKALFDEAELFVITLGLSEVWYDEPTGEVFWRAVPKDKYDPARHKFRVTSHAENLENLQAIHALIRGFRPDAAVLFTVSPIPLTATFRPVTCLSANAVSKAILRAAMDEFFRRNAPSDPRLFYFPSYDIVMHGFSHQWRDDRRHVYSHVLDFNMKVFERYYCQTAMNDEALLASFRYAQRQDRLIGQLGHAAVALHEAETADERKAARVAAAKRRRELERAKIREGRRQQRIAARRAGQGQAIAAE
ncbi:GSCFA domain-containing protein [Inquilinus sp. OTU3971]|uniref:GSCFA domain-containing protein n=1 Tax=Inquilinus sp. OTU3971 TaxID=3043855 RepID=UPI00313CEEB0